MHSIMLPPLPLVMPTIVMCVFLNVVNIIFLILRFRLSILIRLLLTLNFILLQLLLNHPRLWEYARTSKTMLLLFLL